MKRQLVDILRGIIIGIANVIPGLSGGTIAVILNVYSRFINELKDILRHPIKTIKAIWGLLIGIVIGVVLGVYGVVKLIQVAPIPTTLLFVGLIVGAVPKIYQETKGKKNLSCYLSFFIMAAVVVIMPFLPSRDLTIKLDFLQVIILIALGVVALGAMIVPGVSGSMVLMALGYYFYIWGSAKEVISSFLHFDFPALFTNLLPLIPFAVGAIIGLGLVSKLIAKLLEKYPKQVYCAIVGMLLVSPFAIIYSVIKDYHDVMQQNLIINIIIGVVTLIGGYIIALYMEKLGKENDTNIEKSEVQD